MDDRTHSSSPTVEGTHAASKQTQGRRRVQHPGVIQGLVHRLNVESHSPDVLSGQDLVQDDNEAEQANSGLVPAKAPAQQAHLVKLHPGLYTHNFPFSQDELHVARLKSAFQRDRNPEESLQEFISIVQGLKAEGTYFLTRSQGPFCWGTHPSDTHVDLLEHDPHSRQVFQCVTPPETHAKDCKTVSLLCLEDIPNEGLCVRPYIILQQSSVTFNVDTLRRYVSGVKLQGIQDLEKVCLILKVPSNIDPNSIYEKYAQCVVEFEAANTRLKVDGELPDLRLLCQGVLQKRLTPALVKSIDYVIKSDAKRAQDLAIKHSSFRQESEFESLLSRFENVQQRDRQFIDLLVQALTGVPAHSNVQAVDQDQLMTIISYDRLVAFLNHVQALRDSLHLLSVEIVRKCVPHLDPDGRFRALNDLISETLKNKSLYIDKLRKLRELYETQLLKLIDLLSIQIIPNATVLNKEELFKEGIKKILFAKYKDKTLLTWFDQTFSSSRHLLNFLVDHLDAKFLLQEKNPFTIGKNRELVCVPLHQEWQRSLQSVVLVDEGHFEGGLKL